MRISEKPTEYILIRAQTESEWDYCDFALIHVSEEWKKLQAERLEAVKPFANDYNFSSMNFYDIFVNFYHTGDEGEPEIEKLLADKDWAFVELESNELNSLIPPESSLFCYRIVIYRSGGARYEAYGKHTNEEFWTQVFSLQQLIGEATGIEHDTHEVLPDSVTTDIIE